MLLLLTLKTARVDYDEYSGIHFTENHRRIGSSKTEGIGHGNVYFPRTAFIRCDIKITFRIQLVDINGGRDVRVVQGFNAENSFYGCCCT